MKKIAVAFVFFFLLSSGVLLYFVSQTKKTQDLASQAKEGTITTLPLLIDDCNVMYNEECPVSDENATDLQVYKNLIGAALKDKSSSRLLTYTETHEVLEAPELFSPTEQGSIQMTTIDMMTRISFYKNINYKVLLTLLDTVTPGYLSREDVDIKNPFGRNPVSLLGDLNDLSDEIVQNMNDTLPIQFTKDTKQYSFDSTINRGSQTIYAILLASSDTSATFDRKVNDFRSNWQKLFTEKPLTSHPYFLNIRRQELGLPQEQLLR